MAKTKKVKISITAYVDPDAIEELKRHMDHHADWILNLHEYPEIKGICNGKIEVEE